MPTGPDIFDNAPMSQIVGEMHCSDMPANDRCALRQRAPPACTQHCRLAVPGETAHGIVPDTCGQPVAYTSLPFRSACRRNTALTSRAQSERAVNPILGHHAVRQCQLPVRRSLLAACALQPCTTAYALVHLPLQCLFAYWTMRYAMLVGVLHASS